MVNTKVKTAILNRSQQELVLRVGNNNCFTKLATIADESEHNLEIDIHWTYQEFSLEPATAGHGLKKMIITSDDCCDFELMKVTISEGKLQLEKVARGQIKNDVDPPRPTTPGVACGQVENDDVDPSRPASPVVPKQRSYFTWLPTWPKFHWKFWSYGRYSR